MDQPGQALKMVESPAVWRGGEMRRAQGWLHPLTMVQTYLGDFDGVYETAQRCHEMAQRLGVTRFRAEACGWMASAKAALGAQKEAERLSGKALGTAREAGMAYIGPWTSVWWPSSAKKKRRQEALKEGERLLAEGCVSHNYLLFYQNGIEVSLRQKNWDEVERYARALEDYTRAEPLLLMEFYIARGRALARHARTHVTERPARGKSGKKKGGKKGEQDTLAALKTLRDQAQAAGLLDALPTIDAALEEALGEG